MCLHSSCDAVNKCLTLGPAKNVGLVLKPHDGRNSPLLRVLYDCLSHPTNVPEPPALPDAAENATLFECGEAACGGGRCATNCASAVLCACAACACWMCASRAAEALSGEEAWVGCLE